jgi:phosphohistidine phosphatase
MKTLFILRHAKSSWENADSSDFDRVLNAEGLEEAVFMGNQIGKNQIQPDLILCSPAKRAAQTANSVKEAAGLDKEIQFEEKIYEASPLTLLHVISGIEDKNEIVLLVGHNPGLENLIKMLTGEAQSLPTAGLAKINLQVQSWSDIAANSGQQESFISPKDKMKTRTVG